MSAAHTGVLSQPNGRVAARSNHRSTLGHAAASSDTAPSLAAANRVALMTVLSDGRYMERDRDAISLMNCFAMRHKLPYFVETHAFGSNWYNTTPSRLTPPV